MRNGAIGIVPDDVGRVCVTSEYPAYEVQSAMANSRCIKLLFRTATFQRKINTMISGASGRKHVQPSDIEAIEVPLPHLNVQDAIVSAWARAQAEVSDIHRRIAEFEVSIETDFLTELGLTKPERTALPKVFAVWWKEFERWSVTYNQRATTNIDMSGGYYSLSSLGNCLTSMQYGTSKKANQLGRGIRILRINNVKAGGPDTSDLKHIELSRKAINSLLLCDGDILVIRTSGSGDLVGTCAVFHEKGDYIFAS